MSRIVLGLDPSSRKIALAKTTDGKDLAFFTRALKDGGDIDKVCAHAYSVVFRYISALRKRGHTVVLFIEGPVVGRGGVYSTLRQAKVNGAMQAAGVRAGAEVREVNNQTWKKSVVGNGNANKEMIVKWVRENWPHAYTMANGDQDLMDAACINRHGEKIVELKDRIESEEDTRPRRRTRR